MSHGTTPQRTRTTPNVAVPHGADTALHHTIPSRPAPYLAGDLHKQYIQAHRLLVSGPLADSAAADSFKRACGAAFPWSAHFEGSSREEVPLVAVPSGANGVAESMAKLAVTA
jgi:hypothetical protein